MIDKNLTYAVIGASNDHNKFGYKVLVDLHQAGYKVIPVNPKGGVIEGLAVSPDLNSIREEVDIAIFVVPPEVGVKVLPLAREKGIKKIWFQPGSESPEAIDYCAHNGLECVHDACIMVARREQD